MPYHILSAPCLRIIQDKNSGLTSLMDIVDTAHAGPDDKLSLPPFKLFSKWGKSVLENEKERFEVKLSLSGPSLSRNKQLDKFNVEIPEKASGVTIILELGTIDLKEAGLWFVNIDFRISPKSKWKEACSLPFMVQNKKTKTTEQSH
jgi:hypothetical protein